MTKPITIANGIGWVERGDGDLWAAMEPEYVAEIERLRAAHQRIIDEGDYTAPEGMKRIAREALGLPVEPTGDTK